MWPINWASDVSHEEWVGAAPELAELLVSCPLGAMCRERGPFLIPWATYAFMHAATGRGSAPISIPTAACAAAAARTSVWQIQQPRCIDRPRPRTVLFDRQPLKLQYMARSWFLFSSGSTSPEPNFYYSYGWNQNFYYCYGWTLQRLD
jgi:hypothetical protein